MMSKKSDYIIRGPPLSDVPNKGLGQYLMEICQSHQDKVALIDAVTKNSITFRELNEYAIKLAIALRKKGYKEGDVVGICGQNTIYYPIVILATFYMGGILAPWNNGYSVGEMEHVLSLSKPKVVFCSPQNENSVRAAATKHNFIKDVILIEPSDKALAITIEKLTKDIKDSEVRNFRLADIKNLKDTNVLIMCSSGTTGLPKGVVLTHFNVLCSIISYSEFEYDFEQNYIVGFLPPFHVFGLMSLLLFFRRGVTTVLLLQFSPELFLQVLQDYQIKLIAVVPPILSFLAKHPLPAKYDLSSLLEIGVGAAPLGKELEEAVLKRYPHINAIRQGYGMTETTLGVLKVPQDAVKSGSVGKLIAGTEAKIIDVDTKEVLGPNKSGELCFRGPVIMKGYIGNEEATRQAIDSEGWLHTGDIGYYDEDEWFYIVDRLKELIKYKGFQVPPAELEALLLTHPAVLDAAVVGIPNDDVGELPKAFIVKKSPVTAEDITEYIASRVSNPKRLRGGVEFVDAIPKNPSGKILRRVLRDRVKTASKL